MPALRLTVAEAAQSIAIEADPGAFEGQSAALDETEAVAMTPPAMGAFLNYDVFADHYRGETNLNGAFEVGVFTAAGAGTDELHRLGRRRPDASDASGNDLDDRPAKSHDQHPDRQFDFVGRPGRGAAALRRHPICAQFRGPAGLHHHAPARGQRQRGGALGGRRLCQQRASRASSRSTPGPFELRNVPVPSGGGRVQLVMRDLLGPRDRLRTELLRLGAAAPRRPARLLLRSRLPARGVRPAEQPIW